LKQGARAGRAFLAASSNGQTHETLAFFLRLELFRQAWELVLRYLTATRGKLVIETANIRVTLLPEVDGSSGIIGRDHRW
jgi:hypothetical protein